MDWKKLASKVILGLMLVATASLILAIIAIAVAVVRWGLGW